MVSEHGEDNLGHEQLEGTLKMIVASRMRSTQRRGCVTDLARLTPWHSFRRPDDSTPASVRRGSLRFSVSGSGHPAHFPSRAGFRGAAFFLPGSSNPYGHLYAKCADWSASDADRGRGRGLWSSGSRRPHGVGTARVGTTRRGLAAWRAASWRCDGTDVAAWLPGHHGLQRPHPAGGRRFLARWARLRRGEERTRQRSEERRVG